MNKFSGMNSYVFPDETPRGLSSIAGGAGSPGAVPSARAPPGPASIARDATHRAHTTLEHADHEPHRAVLIIVHLGGSGIFSKIISKCYRKNVRLERSFCPADIKPQRLPNGSTPKFCNCILTMSGWIAMNNSELPQGDRRVQLPATHTRGRRAEERYARATACSPVTRPVRVHTGRRRACLR